MSLWKLILTICGVLLGIVLFCAGVIYWQKRNPVEEYDERQMQAQGRASQLAMTTGLIYFLFVIVILIRQVDFPKKVEPWLLVFIGILLMLTVDNTYRLLSHASMPLSAKPIPTIIFGFLGGLVQFLYIWHILDDMPFTLLGHGTSGWLHLLTGIEFFYIALLHLIQYLRDRKE